MTALFVPTLYVEAMVKREMVINGRTFKVGELMRVPYGVALQGLATGTYSAIKDEDAMHMQAIQDLQQYGPDCWFPIGIQTMHRFWAEYEQKLTAAQQTPGETAH